jgi:hypothetical protein
MKEPSKQQLLSLTLDEYGSRAVPDSLDGWPSILARLPGATGSDAMVSGYAGDASSSQPSQQVRSGVAGRARIHKQAQPGRGLPVDLRNRGFNLAVVLILVLGLAAVTALFLTGSTGLQHNGLAGDTNTFVPEGKVRHVVMDVTWENSSAGSATAQPNALEPRTDEIWYANGRNHLLMYITRVQANSSLTETTFVDENAIYEYQSGPQYNASVIPYGGDNIVKKYPYSSRYLDFYGPDLQLLTRLLQSPDTRAVGNSMLLGRAVTEVESATVQTASGPPVPFVFSEGQSLPTPEPRGSVGNKTLVDIQKWIDVQTHQVLKWMVTTTQIAGPGSGDTQTQTIAVKSDELLDAAAFPLGSFQFQAPQGSRVVESTWPPGSQGEAPTPRQK